MPKRCLTVGLDLDAANIRYSYKFPTLLTVTVDPAEGSPNSPSSSTKDPNEWRLACPDPRDQAQYKYRLHTLDVYFWTTDDSKAIVDTLRRHLSPRQLDILDAPKVLGSENLSPVVQQLENVAISDPAYANGQTRNSQNAAAGVPPPPPAMGHMRNSPSSQNANAGRPASMKSNEAPANFTPMAYNPAAPAAPEPIAHREKTPPPPDAANGTGLASAAYADNQAYSNQPQGYPGVASPSMGGHVPYGSPPPPQATYGAPPPPNPYAPQPTNYLRHNPSISSTASHHAASIPPQSAPAPAVSPLSTTSTSSRPGHVSPPQEPNSQFLPPHLQQQQPPLESPSAQIYGGPPQSHHHQPLQHVQPQYADYLQSRTQQQPLQPPPGGYPQYSYPPQQGAHHTDDSKRYDVHQQFYTPTPEEENKYKNRRANTMEEGGRKQGRLDQTAGKVDKKVGSFLKKLEKKL